MAERLQTMILEGVLRPGEKLLPERELAETLGVSRPSLRQALSLLEEKGLLVTQKSGTHVSRFLKDLVDPLAELLADDERVAADYFEFRRSIESHASGLAALRATEPDRAAIRDCLARMRAAHGIDDTTLEANCDVELHGLVYEAAHNVLLLHVMRVLGDLLRRGVFYNREQLYRRPGVRDMLLEQHIAIGETVLSGDARAAEKAAADHINFTYSTIEDIRRDELRMATSLRRIDRKDLVADPGAANRG
ncbi:MAG: GntR family transcriptional regulator [Acidocella sp. 20-61-6]|nr:MAG: GntR family transcriptional regulator [Acidocella sp. 20-61-6]